MKIAFVASCLEEGKDGVGDYTRLLAQECVRQGHECCLLSLNDQFLSQIGESVICFNAENIPILRLPASISWRKRIKLAKESIDAFQPHWVSLQFVCYGFQKKGILINVNTWLCQLLKRRQLHVMFHELWIGEHKGARTKDKLVGRIQKYFILSLIKKLQPQIIHTNSSTYVTVLKKYGIEAKRLPLFGSIPVTNFKGDDWLFPALQKLGLKIGPENRNKLWIIGCFGVLHPSWSSEPFFTYLQQAAIRYARKIVVISIGRIGYGKDLWNNMSNVYSPMFSLVALGEQPDDVISQYFNIIDFGFTTTDYRLVEKSSTVAAMIEHGLPVIVDCQNANCAFEFRNKSIIKLSADFPININKLLRTHSVPKLNSIAKQFISDIDICPI